MLANMIALIFCLVGAMLFDSFIRFFLLVGVAVSAFILGVLVDIPEGGEE